MSWNLGPPKGKSRQTDRLVCIQSSEMKLNQLCFEISKFTTALSPRKINGQRITTDFS